MYHGDRRRVRVCGLAGAHYLCRAWPLLLPGQPGFFSARAYRRGSAKRGRHLWDSGCDNGQEEALLPVGTEVISSTTPAYATMVAESLMVAAFSRVAPRSEWRETVSQSREHGVLS